MIIGINGRIYAGKDETAKVIKRLTITHGNGNIYSYDIKKYAAKLKQIASILTGIPQEKFEDQAFKATDLGSEWNRDITKVEQYYLSTQSGHPLEAPLGARVIKIGEEALSVRKFLQLLGTDCVRTNLHENTWVNALFADYKAYAITMNPATGIYDVPLYPKWIITDCRFPNEYDAVKDRGGLVIRVTRGDDDTIDKSNLHASETSLDGFHFDWVINNTGDLQHLENEVRTFLKEFNLLPA